MIIELKNDVFFEDIFLYKQKEDKTSEKRTHETTFKDEKPSELIVNVKIELRMSKR